MAHFGGGKPFAEDAQFTVPPDEVDAHFSDGRRLAEVRIRFAG
jgi:hypothetical protein